MGGRHGRCSRRRPHGVDRQGFRVGIELVVAVIRHHRRVPRGPDRVLAFGIIIVVLVAVTTLPSVPRRKRRRHTVLSSSSPSSSLVLAAVHGSALVSGTPAIDFERFGVRLWFGHSDAVPALSLLAKVAVHLFLEGADFLDRVVGCQGILHRRASEELHPDLVSDVHPVHVGSRSVVGQRSSSLAVIVVAILAVAITKVFAVRELH
mmetsp:Transcript_18153/g.50539  ORF Transcript_18153/g.50539 Transcript_18153/m.50539 type:complete len:206 (-) Transcript_18153:777-1394(-)